MNRNLLPPLYGVLVIVDVTAGVVVLVVGAVLLGLLWSRLGPPTSSTRRPERAARRAAQRK